MQLDFSDAKDTNDKNTLSLTQSDTAKDTDNH